MKGITKKQFYIQLITALVQLGLGIFWLISGVASKVPVPLILGTIILISAIIMIVTIVMERRNHYIEDSRLSKQYQIAMNGMAMLSGLIGLGCILAFTFAAIFS